MNMSELLLPEKKAELQELRSLQAQCQDGITGGAF